MKVLTNLTFSVIILEPHIKGGCYERAQKYYFKIIALLARLKESR